VSRTSILDIQLEDPGFTMPAVRFHRTSTVEPKDLDLAVQVVRVQVVRVQASTALQELRKSVNRG
jgi:hypothetical protein